MTQTKRMVQLVCASSYTAYPFQHVTQYTNMKEKLTQNGKMLFYLTVTPDKISRGLTGQKL